VAWLPAVTIAPTYDAYRERVLAAVEAGVEAAVLSAAVADYRPRELVAGKMASGRPEWRLELEPTEKVIDQVAFAAPHLPIVSFKYMDGVSHAELMAEAHRRLERYAVVVANRGEEITDALQVAWIVTSEGERRLEGKGAIAGGIADALERVLATQTAGPGGGLASTGNAP
jgi:phosphopantothenoylcysteine decarboxylase/phosphopantothenate--cysteine ligase